jgi:hypothetical protein
MLNTAKEIPNATTRKNARMSFFRLKITPMASRNTKRTSDVLACVIACLQAGLSPSSRGP